jgi:hypothetical protein
MSTLIQIDFITMSFARRHGTCSSEPDTLWIKKEAQGTTNTCYKGNYYKAASGIHLNMHYCCE